MIGWVDRTRFHTEGSGDVSSIFIYRLRLEHIRPWNGTWNSIASTFSTLGKQCLTFLTPIIKQVHPLDWAISQLRRGDKLCKIWISVSATSVSFQLHTATSLSGCTAMCYTFGGETAGESRFYPCDSLCLKKKKKKGNQILPKGSYGNRLTASAFECDHSEYMLTPRPALDTSNNLVNFKRTLKNQGQSLFGSSVSSVIVSEHFQFNLIWIAQNHNIHHLKALYIEGQDLKIKV